MLKETGWISVTNMLRVQLVYNVLHYEVRKKPLDFVYAFLQAALSMPLTINSLFCISSEVCMARSGFLAHSYMKMHTQANKMSWHCLSPPQNDKKGPYRRRCNEKKASWPLPDTRLVYQKTFWQKKRQL